MRRKILIAELEKQLKPIAQKLENLEGNVERLENEIADCKAKIELCQSVENAVQPEASYDNREASYGDNLLKEEILYKLDYALDELRKIGKSISEQRQSEANCAQETDFRRSERGHDEEEPCLFKTEYASGDNTDSEHMDNLNYYHKQYEKEDASVDTRNVNFVRVDAETDSEDNLKTNEEAQVSDSADLTEKSGAEDLLLADTRVFSNTRLYPFFSGREFEVVRDRKKPATVKFDRSAEGRGIVKYTDNKIVSIFTGSKVLGEYYNLGKTRDIYVISVCGNEYCFPKSGDISEQAVFRFVVEEGVLCLYLSTRVWGDEQKSFIYFNEQEIKLAKVD